MKDEERESRVDRYRDGVGGWMGWALEGEGGG